MTSTLMAYVDPHHVQPYIDHVVFKQTSSTPNSTSEIQVIRTIRDDILKPAVAELITDIASDRPGFPGASKAMVDTFFETAIMRMTEGGERPVHTAANRTISSLETLSELIEEMVNLTRVMDSEPDPEPSSFRVM